MTRSYLAAGVLVLLLAAGPALAQVDPGPNALMQARETEQMAQQDLARQRDIALRNDLSALQSQVQTNQRLQELQPHGLDPRLPAPVVPAYPVRTVAGAYPQIPDAALAASRARILAASRNRR